MEDKLVRMPLNTLEHSQQQLTRIMRLRRNGGIDSALFRDLVYSFSVLLNFFKLEKDRRIEERIEELEKLMEARR